MTCKAFLPPVAWSRNGVPGGASGVAVTVLEYADQPISFLARTVNVYCLPLDNPSMVHTVWPVACISYSRISAPLFLPGFQTRVTAPSCDCARMIDSDGASGTSVVATCSMPVTMRSFARVASATVTATSYEPLPLMARTAMSPDSSHRIVTDSPVAVPVPVPVHCVTVSGVPGKGL